MPRAGTEAAYRQAAPHLPACGLLFSAAIRPADVSGPGKAGVERTRLSSTMWSVVPATTAARGASGDRSRGRPPPVDQLVRLWWKKQSDGCSSWTTT
ncbi:hypothetical protein [Saccharothrix lopnurensis]|uniref:Uncharacterized protein n=1 Tax=Saccharothrix lopnurensis TaxID=1670621 RepID=A0ABW1P6D2_9PSEU